MASRWTRGESAEDRHINARHTQAALLEECWRHFDLAVSGGSDFHSPQQKWLALGGLPPFPADGTPVWALPQAGVAPTGARVENAAP